MSPAELMDLQSRCQRRIDTLGWKLGFEADDARQIFLEQALIFADSYDARRGAALETYLLGKMKIEMWESKKSRSSIPVGMQIEYVADLDGEDLAEAQEALAGSIFAGWRGVSDRLAEERIGILPPVLRDFCRALLDGNGIENAAWVVGVCERQGRNLLNEACGLLGAQKSVQLGLFDTEGV